TFIYTIIGTISVSNFLEIFKIYSLPIPLHSDMTLAALFAGAFIVVGLGIVFRNGGTTGGVDIIARIVKKISSCSNSRSIFIYDLIGTISFLIFLEIFQLYSLPIPLHSDMSLAAFFAGAFIGVGLGIVFRNGGTTGGVDIIARIVNKFLGWSIGRSMFLFDL